MFRWCAYCQRFIGEAAPLHSYAVTHGICQRCAETVLEDADAIPATTLIAQRLFHAITAAQMRGEFTLPEALFQEAIDANIRPSDLLLGVLQPALYEIGLKWERGEVTSALEHTFSTWCGTILSRFPETFPPDGSPTILLTPLFANFHVLGIAFLSAFLRDNGMSCLLIVPGLRDDDLVAKCVKLQPAFCGLSVSLPANVERAIVLARKIEAATNGETRTILGGFAFRSGLGVESGITVFQDLPRLLGLLRAS